MQSATNRTCWRASSVPAKAVIQTTSETGSHCVSIHGSPSHESLAYPTTACGESRLIWKGRVTPGTPDELPDFWESAVYLELRVNFVDHIVYAYLQLRLDEA